jgi:hypothetical protein
MEPVSSVVVLTTVEITTGLNIPECARRREQNVGRRHDHYGSQEHPFVAESVSQRAEDGWEEIEEKCRQALNYTAVFGGESETAGGDAIGEVECGDCVKAVPPHALEDLHRVGDPKGLWKLTPDRCSVGHVLFSSLFLRFFTVRRLSMAVKRRWIVEQECSRVVVGRW